VPQYLLHVALLASTAAACTREDSVTLPSAGSVPVRSVPAAEAREGALRQRVHSLGQLAKTPAYAARLARVIECTPERGSGPQPDHVLLGVLLEVTATRDSVAIGHSHAKLVDGAGTPYAALPVAKTDDCVPLFKYSRLARNASQQGWLIFHVPAHARSLTLRLSPRQHLNETATLFKLGR